MTEASRAGLSKRKLVPLPRGAKDALLRTKVVREAWTQYRSRQLHELYERQREYYAAAAEERGLVYDPAKIQEEVRARIAARGYTPAPRRRGDIHTFAAIAMFGWHEHLIPDLHELGPVTHFDYTQLGFNHERIALLDAEGRAQRAAMMPKLIEAVLETHKRRPIDWIVCYGGGQDFSADAIRRIVDETGVPVVNMTFDDKQGFSGRPTGDCRSGAVDITCEFDLFMTSARVACEWHMVEGGRPLYGPEGFSKAAYYPMDLPKDIPMSFIGGAYGFRPATIETLRRARIPVQVFGGGWGTRSVWREEQVAVINRSIVNLGMGGIEYSESLTNVKTRDFEIPGAGGGVYLTSFNPDLALHYVVGEEILCYRNREEMVELARHYLARPDEAAAISARGRARCLREHRWLHRYESMLDILGILDRS